MGRQSCCVRPNGEDIDVGHLLVGLDALLHPRTVPLYSNYGVGNIDPSSWAGDLGAASVWMTRHERENGPTAEGSAAKTNKDVNYFYKKSAPDEDLLADVDSFGLKAQWDAAPGQKLSDVIRSYYEGTGATSVRHRFEIFCNANDLKYTRNDDGTINWDSALLEQLTARVDHFNDLYDAGPIGVVWTGIITTEPEHEKWQHTPAIANKFLDWVKTNLEAEFKRSSGKKT